MVVKSGKIYWKEVKGGEILMRYENLFFNSS
jgi:hypothetical protein